MSNTTTKPKAIDSDTDSSEVIDYLIANPNFFNEHSHVLAQMNLAHESGTATSLIERQVSILRKQNHKTRAELHDASENARLNEQLSDKIHRLGLALLATDKVSDSLEQISNCLNDDFSINKISVQFWNDKLNVDAETLNDSNNVGVSASNDESFAKYLDKLKRAEVVCGQLNNEDISNFFGADQHIASAALLPLFHQHTFGVIGLGCKNEDRFRRDLGTVFLKRLAELISQKLWLQLSPKDVD